MNARLFFATLALTAVLAGTAHAHQAKGYRLNRVVVHFSNDHVTVPNGDTPLGKSVSFKCKDTKGCFVTIAAYAQAGNTAICSSVDGVQALPKCIINRTDFQVNSRQIAKLGTGEHTIQTTMRRDDPTCTVEGYEIEYTFYQ